MFLVNNAMVDITVGTAAITAVLGYAVVFFGLVLLMGVIIFVGKIMVSARKKKAASNAQDPVPVTEAAAAEPVYATGAAGKLALHEVDPKTAALLMAIVADKMGKPINELQFKSIREVK